MSKRLPVTPAPGLLEQFSVAFDTLFSKRNQREAFRQYLANLLLPNERNKTLTALANTEPVLGAHHPRVQQLQWFLTESTWDAKKLNGARLSLLRTDTPTAPTTSGVLVIDETGDRKAGTKTAHVGRQYLANLGKIDNGVVSVTSLWADERLYYPLEVEPYTPAHWFEQDKADPRFRTKPQIALELVQHAVSEKLPFRAVVADSLYGEHTGFRTGLHTLNVGFVLALKPSHTWWHPVAELGSLFDIAAAAGWQNAQQPGTWAAITRSFRDGHTEIWWALEVIAGPYGPDKPHRAVVVTTDPSKLPETNTWYLITNLPAPGSERAKSTKIAAATLEEIVRLYGLRMWIERSYKQVKQALGWAEYQVRSDQAIRRHWALVCCAFTFCWWYASLATITTQEDESLEKPSNKMKSQKLCWKRKKTFSQKCQRPNVSWPAALRQVRAWLEPWIMLRRYWRAWSKRPPPLALQQLLESLWLGNGINIYNSS